MKPELSRKRGTTALIAACLHFEVVIVTIVMSYFILQGFQQVGVADFDLEGLGYGIMLVLFIIPLGSIAGYFVTRRYLAGRGYANAHKVALVGSMLSIIVWPLSGFIGFLLAGVTYSEQHTNTVPAQKK